MGKPETMEAYLAAAGEQLRWRRARPLVLRELGRHLEDQRDAFVQEGHSPEEAERLAVEEMGDPEIVGAELDALHRPRPQWGPLTMIVLLALLGGFLRVWLTAAGAPYYDDIDPVRTALAVLLGTGGLIGMYFLDCAVLVRRAGAVYLLALAAGIFSLIHSPNISNVSYYTRYVVLCYPVVYVLWVCRCRGGGAGRLLLALAGGVPLAVVCILAPSVTGLLLLLLTGFIVLLMAIRMGWFHVSRGKATVLICGLAAVMAGGTLSVITSVGRFMFFLHPETDPSGRGYQALAIRQAVAAARWVGEGSGEALEPFIPYERMVPGWSQDLLLTTVLYKLGWLACLVLVAALAGLLVWLLVRCRRQRSQWGRLLALAVLIPFGLQLFGSVVLNLGFVLTSVHVPLLVGNLHTVMDLTFLGLTLSVLRGDAAGRMEDAAVTEKPLRIPLFVR